MSQAYRGERAKYSQWRWSAEGKKAVAEKLKQQNHCCFSCGVRLAGDGPLGVPYALKHSGCHLDHFQLLCKPCNRADTEVKRQVVPHSPSRAVKYTNVSKGSMAYRISKRLPKGFL